MWSRWIALVLGALLASQEANAACVIHGARPTVPLPTMPSGQEFSFLASADCETLRFTIRGSELSKHPQSGESVGPGPQTYKVHLTESEWDAVVAESGPRLTWIITGKTSAGVTTRMVTTNDLKRDEQVTIDLSMADAKLVGEEAADGAGRSVSGAGDVNADGHDDLLVGAPNDQEGDFYGGAAYLVLGPVTGTFDLSLATAKLLGEERFDRVGESVSQAGDVDGDGHDDLLIGTAHHPYYFEGAAYLVLGPVSGTLDLSLADAKLLGEEQYDLAGHSVSAAGDVDGDGHDDLLVGAEGNDEAGTGTGAAYLVLGPVTGTLALPMADAKLVGEDEGDEAGTNVAGAGDVDGDGNADMLVGADGVGVYRAGAAYLVRGPVTGTLDLSLADAKLVGEEAFDYAGGSVSGAGDVDGDGHDDLLIGADENYEGGYLAGAGYLVLGPVTGTLDLSLADAKFVGEESRDEAGVCVSGAGDVDGDGHHDMLVSASEHGASGAAYLMLGPVTGTLGLSVADAKFVGERRGDAAGNSVSDAGDVDGDGRSDILVGAYANDEGGSGAGAAYLIYGGGL